MTRDQHLQDLVEKMGKVLRGARLQSHSFFGDYQLGRPKLGILFILSKHKEGVAVKDLAEKLGVTSGAVTQFIDGLVEHGLVSRTPDSHDRRVSIIQLTDAAEAKFSQFRKDYVQSVSELFRGLNDDEMEQLYELFQKVEIPTKPGESAS